MTRAAARKQGSKAIEIVWKPRNEFQKDVAAAWRTMRIGFLTGEAGTGKTSAALGLAALDWATKGHSIYLARPSVGTEDLGFEPGDLVEKLINWHGPFADVFGDMCLEDFERLARDKSIQLWPVGRLKGRTVKHGTLIVDEAQDLTFTQLRTAVTRVGEGGRVVFCGDQHQIDNPQSGLREALDRLFVWDSGGSRIPKVQGVELFEATENLRDPIVNQLSRLLRTY